MNTEYGRIWDWKSHEDSPLRWRNPCVARLKGDPFEETPFEVLDRVFAVMALRLDVTFQLLTKRPERMREYMTDAFERLEAVQDEADYARGIDPVSPPEMPWPLPNVWLGVSVENQQWADVRLPELLATPAAVRFVSCEPMLGAVDFWPWVYAQKDFGRWLDADGNEHIQGPSVGAAGGLHWIIFGGESGPGARPCDIGWIRAGVEQCRAAGVPAFVKQDSGPRPGMQGRIPDDLWIKEFPNAVH